MVNYGNGKIYKIEPICDHEDGEIYIGSTTKKYLSQRMDRHRSAYKQWKEGKYHKFSVFDIFDKYGIDNCKIYLLENCPCETKDELHRKEGQFIKNNKCVNKIITGRTPKEYKHDNMDKIKEYRKEYDDLHRNEKKEYDKEYRNDNKERISLKKKEYNELNKEKIRLKEKQYREDNKEMIRARQNKKIICDCGCSYTYSNKNKHLKSMQHITYLKTIEYVRIIRL